MPVTVEGQPFGDPKKQRIRDPNARPYDNHPVDHGYCPLCLLDTSERSRSGFERHHVVGAGQGGDDVPKNLVWMCVTCHGELPPQAPPGSLPARRLVFYCRQTMPEIGRYTDEKKFPGWLEERYLGHRYEEGDDA